MRVLFVEDNDTVRELIGEMLADEGLDVVACASAEAAEIEFGRGDFAVVMTDVSLPSMPGTELARRLLRKSPDLWIVFVSGYSMTEGLAAWGPRARSLLKPFDDDELHRLMTEIRAGLGPRDAAGPAASP